MHGCATNWASGVVEASRHDAVASSEHDRTVIKAGHSVGKTRGLSRLVAWWIAVHPIGEALVVITSDNNDQITRGIWNELIALDAKLKERDQDEKGGLPGNITLDGKWHAGPNNKQLVAIGRKPADRNPTGIQGYHRRYLLVIIEECCGVPQEIWDACDSLASNEGGIILACGNPTDPAAYMAEVCKPGSGWKVKQIRSIDTPEFTGEVVPPGPGGRAGVTQLGGEAAQGMGSAAPCTSLASWVSSRRSERHPDRSQVDRGRAEAFGFLAPQATVRR